MHFVHERNSDNDPLEFSRDWEDTMEYVDFPNNFTLEGEPIFQTNIYEEESYGLESDAGAMEVLKKILHDGIIRSGWSYRNGKPTIYGPKSAVCFTEMPLYALIEYSKNRNDNHYVEPYGIAFLRAELFKAGARPVIYGLSGKHVESISSDPNYKIGLRTLSTSCGLGLKEMYRYVYTNINSQKRIDWTHEREWRWADLDERFDWPGLPFYADNDFIEFSKIIVFVKTNDEVDDIIVYLQHIYHSESTNYDRPYNLRVIENTSIVSFEALSKLSDDVDSIKLDDLPLKDLPKLSKIEVSKELVEKIKKAIEEASKINYEESEKLFKQVGDVGGCGRAHVVTYESRTEITQALIDLGIARSYGTGHYYVDVGRSYPAQSLDIDEIGKIKAAEFLTKELGQWFHTHWEWD